MRHAVFAPADLNETTLATAPAGSAVELLRADQHWQDPNRSADRLERPTSSRRLPLDCPRPRPLRCRAFRRHTRQAPMAIAMLTSQRTLAGIRTGYGIGFEVHPSPFGLFAGHTGAVDGGTAALLIHPESQTVLALTTNLGYATAETPPPPRKGRPIPPWCCCHSSRASARRVDQAVRGGAVDSRTTSRVASSTWSVSKCWPSGSRFRRLTAFDRSLRAAATVVSGGRDDRGVLDVVEAGDRPGLPVRAVRAPAPPGWRRSRCCR